MSKFQSAFREIVVPDLRKRCRTEAMRFDLGLCDYSEAQSAVIHAAFSRGAGNLPDQLQLDLLDWISATLLREVDAVEKMAAEHHAMSERVAADCNRYFAAHAAATEELVW